MILINVHLFNASLSQSCGLKRMFSYFLTCAPFQDLTPEAEKDPQSQWSFQDVFNEDCIVLDPVSVLPVQYEITNCLLPISQGKKFQIYFLLNVSLFLGGFF